MNKKEKVKYEQQLALYLQKNKVQDTFHYLFKQLLLKRPEDPLQFLIDELRTKRKTRLIFLSGYAKVSMHKISESLAARMNFKLLSYTDFIQNEVRARSKCGEYFTNNYLDVERLDNNLFDKVVASVKGVESQFKGVLLEGFPNNLAQFLYLTKRGLIPERFFYLNYSAQTELEEGCKFLEQNKQFVNGKVTEMSDYMEQHKCVSKISVAQMKESYQSLITDVNAEGKNIQSVVSEIEMVLSPKERAVTPLRSPQILVLSVISNISNPIVKDIAKKFGLNNVCTQELINDEIARKSVVGHFCHQAREAGEFVPDDVFCALTQNEISKTHSQHLGWVMDGYPMTKKQLSKFLSWRCPAQMIIILETSPEYTQKRAELVKFDPKTGRTYNLSKETVEKDVLARLEVLKSHRGDCLKKRQSTFVEMIVEMENNKNLQKRMCYINPEKTTVSQIHEKIHQMMRDPQFYS